NSTVLSVPIITVGTAESWKTSAKNETSREPSVDGAVDIFSILSTQVASRQPNNRVTHLGGRWPERRRALPRVGTSRYSGQHWSSAKRDRSYRCTVIGFRRWGSQFSQEVKRPS